jgi:hypothetical protein
VLKLYGRVGLLRRIVGWTPLYVSTDWDKEYPMLDHTQRVEIFKTEMVDALYAHYDAPMSPREVIDALAEIGQRPYSYDQQRNQYRCRKTESSAPIKVVMVKHGVFRVEPKA